MTEAPLHDLARFTVDPDSVQRLGYGFCKRKHVVVLGAVKPDSDDAVTVGMLDPGDAALIKTLRQYLRREIDPMRLTKADILKALDMGHGRWEAPEGQAVLQLRPAAGIDVPAADDPIQAALIDLLRRAIDRGATAVHVLRSAESVEVRARVGGVLLPIPSPLRTTNAAAFISRFKALAGLDAEDVVSAQSGRVALAIADAHEGSERELLLQVGTLPGRYGEDLTVRIRGGTLPRIDLDALGLLAPQLEALRTALFATEGIVMLCGPPGSGRTTTLYACLEEFEPQGRKVLSVEDPIARNLPHVGQRQLGVTGRLADQLRAFIDHDADVVAIDRLHGKDAVRATVELGAAQQLLLAARTSTGPAAAVALLVAEGAPASWVADATTLVVHGRIARRRCPDCADTATLDAFAEAVVRRLGRALDLQRPRGCDKCHGIGYAGRIGLFELMHLDTATAPLVDKGTGAAEVRAAARRGGMLSLFDAGVAHVESGATTLDEVRRVVPSRIVAEWLNG